MKTIEPNLSMSHEAEQAIRRYRDGYRVARSLDGLGNLANGLAAVVIVGGIFAAICLHGSYGIVALLIGCGFIIAGIFIYIVATVISAIGQGIKAQFDTAVHTSPFLSEGQKSVAMSL